MANHRVKTIFIHAGLHKTGTSSIQASLANNEGFLEENSLYYFTELGVNHSEFVVPMFMEDPSCYYLAMSRNLSSISAKEEFEEKKECLKAALLQSDRDKVILSGEDISGMNVRQLNKMKNFFQYICPEAEIKVVICLREPSEYIASALQQSIKTGFCSVRLFEQQSVYFRKVLEKFIEVFGENWVFAYDFNDAKKHPYGLVGFFLEKVLGISAHGFSDLKIIRDNDSIKDIAVDLIGYINQVTDSSIFAQGPGNGKLSFDRYLNDTQALWGLDGNKFKLEKSYVRKLYILLSGELDWLREKFDIDYSFDNASYTDRRFSIPESFFNTTVIAFPKLSRVVRRAFYDWIVLELIKRSTTMDCIQLTRAKNWIEKEFPDTCSKSLAETKEQLAKEMSQCEKIFKTLGVKGKSNYQLYYHLHILLLNAGSCKSAVTMLHNFYEKNPHWSESWQPGFKERMRLYLKCFFYFFKSSHSDYGFDAFLDTFQAKGITNQILMNELHNFCVEHRLSCSFK